MQNRTSFVSQMDVVLLVLLILLTASQISVFIPFFSQSVILLLTTFLLFFIDSRFFYQKVFGILLFYFVIVFFNFMSGDDYFSNILHVFEEIGNLLLPSAVLFYVLRTQNVKLMKALVLAFFIYTIYITISSAIIEAIEPGAIRRTVVLALYNDTAAINDYLRKGLSSYMFPHALPIVIPPLIMALKKGNDSKIQRIFLTIVLIAVIYMIYLSSVATALLLAFLIATGAILMKSMTSSKDLVIMLMGGLILFFILFFWLSNGLLHELSFIFSDTAFGSKFDDIEMTMTLGTARGDINSRMDKYSITINAMEARNFIWGSNEPMGGHSALFDRLGSLGLLGFIPYLAFLYLQIKFTLRFIPREGKVYYLLGGIAAFVMLFLKNTSNWHLWSTFLLYLPIMIILFSHQDSKRICKQIKEK